MDKVTKQDIIKWTEYGEIDILFPKEKDKASAYQLASVIEAAIGVATFIGKDEKLFYGVMIKKSSGYDQMQNE